jgi:hypothetical protein
VFRATQGRNVTLDQQDVMSIVTRGIRATPRKWGVDRNACSTRSTSQTPNDGRRRLWIGAQHVNRRRDG